MAERGIRANAGVKVDRSDAIGKQEIIKESTVITKEFRMGNKTKIKHIQIDTLDNGIKRRSLLKVEIKK